MSLELVSDNDTEDGKAKRAARELGDATACLAANLLRIISGAGKPWQIRSEAERLIAACEDPHSPATAIAEGAQDFDWRRNNPRYSRPSQEDIDRWERDGTAEFESLLDEIAKHALRWRAAQLLEQPTQERTAHYALTRAARALAAWRPRT